MAKIGRNKPCPCGSGKKYKKCCLNKKRSAVDSDMGIELDELMQAGYSFLEMNRTTEACDAWLEFWDRIKPYINPEIDDVEKTDKVFSGLQSIFNWCQDFESELGNAGVDDDSYYQKRIQYCTEFCSLFPKSSEILMHNMKRAVAESYFALDDYGKGEKLFKALIKEFPDNIWGYIGWGDMCFMTMKNSRQKPDYEKAEQIYRMGLGKNLEEEEILIERLEDLKKAKANY